MIKRFKDIELELDMCPKDTDAPTWLTGNTKMPFPPFFEWQRHKNSQKKQQKWDRIAKISKARKVSKGHGCPLLKT